MMCTNCKHQTFLQSPTLFFKVFTVNLRRAYQMSIKSAYITSIIAFMRPKIQPPKVFHWIQSNLIRFTASCPDYQLHRTTPSHSMKLVKHRPIFIYGGRSVNQNSIPSNSVSLYNRSGSSMFKLSNLYQLSMSIRIRSSSMGAVA